MDVDIFVSGESDSRGIDLTCGALRTADKPSLFYSGAKDIEIDGAKYSLSNIEDVIAKTTSVASTSVCFHHFISRLSGEFQSRLLVALAVGAANKRCLIVERRANDRVRELVFKIAKCLDARFALHEVGDDEIYELTTSASSVYPLSLYDESVDEEAFLSGALGRPVPGISISELLDLVEERLRQKEGFSLVRFNHCEPRVLGYGTLFYDEDLNRSFAIQWGHTEVSEGARYMLSNLMAYSMNSADVIGLPSIRRRIETHLNILENSCFVQLRDRRLLRVGARFTHVNVHFLLGRQARFFGIMAKVDRLVLITGRNVVDKLKQRIGRRDFVLIAVPAEAIHAKGPRRRHYPDAFPEIEQRVRAEIKAGDLVLVGAGLMGKYYCSLARENGAVALDIGSLFDAWEGLHTRGKGFPPELVLP